MHNRDDRLHDEMPRPRFWQRPALRGCLLALAVPALVMLGMMLTGFSPWPRTWYVEGAEKAAFSADGRLVMIPTGPLESLKMAHEELAGYSLIELHAAEGSSVVLRFKASFVRRVAFSPDGRMMASIGADQIIRLWRVSDALSLGTLSENLKIVDHGDHCIVFSPDGQLLAAGNERDARIWRVSDGTLLQTLAGGVRDLAFSPDGQLLAVSGGQANVALWRISDGRQLRVLAQDRPTGLAFSPDGEQLAVGSASIDYVPGRGQDLHGEVRLWRLNAEGAPPERVLRTGEWINQVAFSPDGQLLAAGGARAYVGGSFGEWDDFWPSRTIYLWRMPDGQGMGSLWSPHKQISGLAFSADGQTLFSTGVDRSFQGNLAIWRVAPHVAPWRWLLPASVVAALGGWGVWAWRRGTFRTLDDA